MGYTLVTLEPVRCHFIPSVQPGVPTDNASPVMIIVYHMATSSRIMHHFTKLKTFQSFYDHKNEFTILQQPPQLTDLNLIEQLLDVVEQEDVIRLFSQKMCSFHTNTKQHF